MPKTPKPDDIILARRLEGHGSVSVASALPDYKGFVPVQRITAGGIPQVCWDEGACIPMRFIEACERDDCEPLDVAGNAITVGEPGAPVVDATAALQPGVSLIDTEEPASAGED